MSAYKKIINTIAIAAKNVNQRGTFLHGTYLDLSVQTDLIRPIIQLLMPFTVQTDRDRSSATATVIVFFGRDDNFDSNEAERQKYVDEMAELCETFLDELDENSSGLIDRTTGVVIEPLYKVSSQTLTGVGCQFTIAVAGC